MTQAMRIELDGARCSGHARCYAVDADLFPIDDDGYSVVTAFDVPEGLEQTARRGVDACPELALLLVEGD